VATDYAVPSRQSHNAIDYAQYALGQNLCQTSVPMYTHMYSSTLSCIALA